MTENFASVDKKKIPCGNDNKTRKTALSGVLRAGFFGVLLVGLGGISV